MDRRWGGDANGWVAVLRNARAAGLVANLELMTTAAARLAELGRPCLPHLDFLIVNDFEIGALAGRATRRDRRRDRRRRGRASHRRCARARARCAGSWRIFPGAPSPAAVTGSRLALGSVALPASAIAGANGAGDAFAAGMLYALHEEWPIGDCLRLAHAAAAASMRAVSTTVGVASVAECLALAETWGLRPVPA